jgi:hypothetical protein
MKIRTLGLSSLDVTLDLWRKADKLLVVVSREEGKKESGQENDTVSNNEHGSRSWRKGRMHCTSDRNVAIHSSGVCQEKRVVSEVTGVRPGRNKRSWFARCQEEKLGAR